MGVRLSNWLAFSLGVWIVILTQIGFFYYYNLSAIWLCLVLTAFFATFGPGGRRLLIGFTVVSGLMFLYFLPIISAAPLPPDDTWTTWVWLKSWY